MPSRLALAAVNHHVVSVTVRPLSPPDRNWNAFTKRPFH